MTHRMTLRQADRGGGHPDGPGRSRRAGSPIHRCPATACQVPSRPAPAGPRGSACGATSRPAPAMDFKLCVRADRGICRTFQLRGVPDPWLAAASMPTIRQSIIGCRMACSPAEQLADLNCHSELPAHFTTGRGDELLLCGFDNGLRLVALARNKPLLRCSGASRSEKHGCC